MPVTGPRPKVKAGSKDTEVGFATCGEEEQKMEFEEISDSAESKYLELRSGNYTIVVLRYLFGQRRIQVWYDRWHAYPDVLSPQF